MRRPPLLALAALFVTACVAAHAQTPPVQFTTTQFGLPNPVAAGGTVTWHLQGLNEGTETLADIAWSSPECGTHSFPGTYVTGASTPELTCATTAPATGVASLTVQWSAVVVSTQQLLAPIVTTTVPVIGASTTTTTTTTITTASSTTTTTSAPTTTSTTSSTAPTTTPTGSSTGTTAAVGPATSSQTSAAPTSASNIPITGRDGTSATNVALFALAVGFALVVVARLRTTREQ